MRASSSCSAAARRTRLVASWAGVMSASAVMRGNPCRRAARAPMSTNWTWCRASVVNNSSGSSGSPRSDTTHALRELTDVLDFLQALFGRHGEDAGHLVQHVRPDYDLRLHLRGELVPGSPEQTLQGIPGWARQPALDPGDDRLSRPSPLGELTLAQACP